MSRYVVQQSWSETAHLSEKNKNDLISAYAPHERSARTEGKPQLGSGAVYPIAEEDIVIPPFKFPAWYRHAYGLDVGWNRTAGIWGAVDPETDIVYLYAEHYRGEAEPPVHAAAIKSLGDWIAGAIDPAARGRSQADGTKLLETYRSLGLHLTPADNRKQGPEGGVMEVWMRLSSGRLKVFANLQNWLMEFRLYRRNEKGGIVKDSDHLMDATRYLCMTGIGLAAIKPRSMWERSGPNKARNHTYEHDPFKSCYDI